MEKSPKKIWNILSFGEVLWDMLPGGKKFGGAPANFAFHCKQLGAEVRLLSCVGRDALGEEILEHCAQLGLDTEFVRTDDAARTGVVTVTLDVAGQPRYKIEENVAWDFLQAGRDETAWAAAADAMCFGSLAARSEINRRTLHMLVEHMKPEALRVLDLNMRDPFCSLENIDFVLRRANVLKLNDEELDRVTDMLGLTPGGVEARLRELGQRYDLRLMILTCGAAGSWLVTEAEAVFTPSVEVKVVDTVGAGDAFTAATVLGFLDQLLLPEVADRATRLAAFVCTRAGGTPVGNEELGMKNEE